MPEIIVTIPAYNEQSTIRQIVTDVANVLRGKDFATVVVSDGSIDNTIQEAKEAGAIVHDKQHGGRADTFRYTMEIIKAMNPRWIVTTDADGQYEARDITDLLAKAEQGYDLVLGNRLSGYIEYMPVTKRILNILGTAFFSYALWVKIGDATTGLRVFNMKVANLPIKSNFTFTVEQLVRAREASYKMTHIPVTFYKRQDGNSRLMKSSSHYIWETIKSMRSILS